MPAKTVEIPLDADVASLYERASAEEKRKIQLLLRLRLHEILLRESKPLAQLMDEISDKAEARGLTPEILQSILDDDA